MAPPLSLNWYVWAVDMLMLTVKDFFLQIHGIDPWTDPERTWLPERLWHRLICLRAFELRTRVQLYAFATGSTHVRKGGDVELSTSLWLQRADPSVAGDGVQRGVLASVDDIWPGAESLVGRLQGFFHFAPFSRSHCARGLGNKAKADF
jgi:hypothetical protein